MRGVILILILLVVVAIAAIATGFINISQTRPAEVPQVSATGNGVVAKGGQAPAFRIETGKVQVKPPEIQVVPTGNAQAPTPAPQAPAQPSQPAPAQPAPATTDSTQR